MADAKAKAQSIINDNDVVVFSKTWCSYSKSAKQTLKSAKADFAVYELDEIDDGDELQAALEEITGQRTVPNIFINHKHVGGNSELQKLGNKLNGMLKEANALKA